MGKKDLPMGVGDLQKSEQVITITWIKLII